MKKFFLITYGLLIATLSAGQIERFAFVLPASFFYLHDIVIAFIILGWLGFTIKKGLPGKPKLAVPLVAFLLSMVLSFILHLTSYSGNELLVGFGYLVRFIAYAFIYIVIYDLVKAKIMSWHVVITGLILLGINIAFGGLIQYFWYPNLGNLAYLGWDPHAYRLFSQLLDPNFTGLIIVFTIFLIIDLLLKAKKSQKKEITAITILFLLMVSLELTYSRSSYMAFVVGLPILLWRKNRKLMTALLFIFLVSLLFLPRPPNSEGVKLERTSTVYARWTNFSEVTKVIRSSPLFGVGFNMYRYARNRLPLAGKQDNEFEHAGAGADNSFLFIWATTGAVGLVFFIWFWVSALKIGKGLGELLPVVSSSVAAALVHSWFVNSLFYPWILVWLAILMGTAEARDYT